MSPEVPTADPGREVEIETSGALMAIWLNRPDKKNALTAAMYSALADALEVAEADNQIRIVTLAGRGRDFSAGNDLGDFLNNTPTDLDQPVFHFIRTAASFPKILVAGVRGAAVGIGTTILLHCDIVLAESGATFLLPFVNLGLVPEAASTLLLPRLVGRQLAARYLLLGEPFDTEAALRFGLVTDLIADGQLEARLEEMARKIAAKPPAALLQTKRLLLADTAATLASIETEARIFIERLQSDEAQAAFSSFFKKRAG